MRRVHLIAFLVLLCAVGFTAAAQEQTRVVTDDQVNAIAKKLYCPVCENITLDTCGTAACDDWRNEIRIQLEQGRSEEEIVSDFVNRFGDRVVGTPQDAALRALSLVTPWIMIAGVLLLLGWMVLSRRRPHSASSPAAPSESPGAQKYQELIEQDLES